MTKLTSLFPSAWSNDLSNITPYFVNGKSDSFIVEYESVNEVGFFTKPFNHNVSEYLVLDSLGDSEIVVKSWVKPSGEDLGGDALILQVLAATDSPNIRTDIITPFNAIKPPMYPWQASGSLNAHISIIGYSLWLSQWYAYQNFFLSHPEAELTKSLSERFLNEVNLVIEGTYLVSVITNSNTCQLLFWDTLNSLQNVYHGLGISGYEKEFKIKKRFTIENPTNYAKLSPSDNLNIIYREYILKSI